MANHNNFNEGAFHLSRSIFNSDIWFKPAEYLKIFVYLIGKANHKPVKYDGFIIERGQHFCNYNELRDQVSYLIGYRKKSFNESHTKRIMKYLRDTQRITTLKKPRGVLITVCNYKDYQDLEKYEKTKEKTTKATISEPAANQGAPSINKNEKNEKNDSKDSCPKKSKKLLIAYPEKFEEFKRLYPRKQAFYGIKGGEGAWNKAITEGATTEEILSGLKDSLKDLQKEHAKKKTGGTSFCPYPATWLNQKRWNDKPDQIDNELDEYNRKKLKRTIRIVENGKEIVK